MYLHIDSSNYGEAKIGVATSDSVCGRYTYLGSWRPLGFESRDIGLFQDDDGAAYLLTEDVSLQIYLPWWLMYRERERERLCEDNTFANWAVVTSGPTDSA